MLGRAKVALNSTVETQAVRPAVLGGLVIVVAGVVIATAIVAATVFVASSSVVAA